MNNQIFKPYLLSTLTLCSLAHAHDSSVWQASRPDSHAPISVMGEHTHNAGEWMLSYRYMHMSMEGMRSGTNGVSSQDVFAENYTVTPESMTMDMHMFGMMYAPTDTLTLMAMASYKYQEMDHRIFSGAGMLIAGNGGSDTFTTESEGFGDLKLTGLYRFWADGHQRAHFGFGVSLPTGSIGERDGIPSPGGVNDSQLPAPMQLGSGTVDLLPSITYLAQFGKGSYGTQLSAVIRTGENAHEYRLGNQYTAQVWGSYLLTESLSVSSRLAYRYVESLQGTQSDLMFVNGMGRRTVTTAFSENYGGESSDVALGLNYTFSDGSLKGNRLAAEFSVPWWQDLNGFQLETEYTLTLGWQRQF